MAKPVKRFKEKIDRHTADCIETDLFQFRGGMLTFGLARGLPHKDNIYFRIVNAKGQQHTRYLNEHEAMAIVAGLSRAVWIERGLKDKKRFANVKKSTKPK